MRARLLRPALGLALTSAAVLSIGASAAVKPLVIEDGKGDANAIHDNGTGTFGTGTATPVSDAGKDIVSLTLARLPGKACTGYTATLELAGAPTSNTVYRILGSTSKNTSYLWPEYANNPVSGTTSRLRWSDGTTGFVELATPAKVDGSKVTLTILEKDLKAAGEKLASLNVQGVAVDVRTSTGVVTAPSWDIAGDETKSFKPCG